MLLWKEIWVDKILADECVDVIGYVVVVVAPLQGIVQRDFSACFFTRERKKIKKRLYFVVGSG